MKLTCFLLSTALILRVTAKRITYDGCKVYRVKPNTTEQLSVIKNMQEQLSGVSMWNYGNGLGIESDIMVSPKNETCFLKSVSECNMKFEVLIEDVQSHIDRQISLNRQGCDGNHLDWTKYCTLDEIYNWLISLVELYPSVSLIEGGESYEGKGILGVKISYKSGNRGVVIEGGIHAREWIAPATVTHIINEFLTSKDPVIRDLVLCWDFYVFPIVNPDGYIYSWYKDRLWRKSRSYTGNPLCRGVDLNRNWGFHWNEGGASNNPCDETYCGTGPFSEIETKTFSDYLYRIKDHFFVYISFHSYSQLLMFPYGYTDERVCNYDEMMCLAKGGVKALAKNNGTQYTYGSIYEAILSRRNCFMLTSRATVVGDITPPHSGTMCHSCAPMSMVNLNLRPWAQRLAFNLFDPASGGSLDWTHGILGKKYSFVWELRDTGKYGFLLPPYQICDTAKETLNSVVDVLQHVKSTSDKLN